MKKAKHFNLKPPFWIVFLTALALVSTLRAQEQESETVKTLSPAVSSGAGGERNIAAASGARMELRRTTNSTKKDFRLSPLNPNGLGDTYFKVEPEKSAPFPSAPRSLPNFGRKQANQTSGGYTRPTAKQRFKGYLSGVVGPYTLLGVAAFAGVYHYRDLPPEWENDGKGYARRFGSSLGILAINKTTSYALDEALKLDSNFYKSTKKTVGGRLRDAVVSSFTARRPDGRRVLGAPHIAGVYTAQIAAYKSWYPDRFGYQSAARDGTLGLGFDVAINIFREFFPFGK